MSLLVHLPLTGNLENKGLANVTVTNSGATVDNDGKIGKCYSFSNNSIMINYALPATEHEWSYCCWAKLNNNSGAMCLYSSRTSTNFAQRTIFLLVNKGVCFDDGTRISGTLNTTATLTDWCHYAFSRSSNKINVYVNGSLAFSSSFTAFPSSVSTNTFFGASQYSNTAVNANYLAGSLNDIRVYDHALSPKEVKELSKGLVAHYKLDDVTDNTIYDCSGYGNNGTTVGTLSLSNDSPRYKYSTLVPQASTITHNNPIHDLEWTCSCWIYPINLDVNNIKLNNLARGMFIKFTSNGKSLLCINEGPPYYRYSHIFDAGLWLHIVFVYRHSDKYMAIYKNGVKDYEIGPSNGVEPSIATTTTLFLNFNGYVSDYRLYCTALSDEDVVELYNTSAFITDNGTTECYEFDEVDDELSINKNGIMKMGNIYEAEAKYTDAFPVTVLKTSFSLPSTGTNKISKFFSFPLENAVPGKVYTVEYDFIWEGTWAASGGTLYVRAWGELVPKSGYSTGYSTGFGGSYESFVVTSTSGTYHYKGNFTMISTCLKYTTWNVGIRVDYSDGNGQYKLENFKIYPVEMRIDTEQTKIGNDYVTSREFIEI